MDQNRNTTSFVNEQKWQKHQREKDLKKLEAPKYISWSPHESLTHYFILALNKDLYQMYSGNVHQQTFLRVFAASSIKQILQNKNYHNVGVEISCPSFSQKMNMHKQNKLYAIAINQRNTVRDILEYKVWWLLGLELISLLFGRS